MSISATSGSGSAWGMNSLQQQRRTPPELTKDQLTQLDQTLKSEGKDTSNLDKIVSSFDQLDTDGNGKVSMDELKTNAAQSGISMPKGGHHHHKGHPPGPPPGQDSDSSAQGVNSWGPPPGLLSDSASASGSSSGSASSTDPNSFMLSLLEKFAGSDPTTASQSTTASSSVNIAA